MPRPQLLERLILFTLGWTLLDSSSPSPGLLTAPRIQGFSCLAAQWWPLETNIPGATDWTQGKEPQGCAEAVAQGDERFSRCCYRMGCSRGCSAAQLGAAGQVPSPRETSEPQVPSVIHISSCQLHQPFWAISSTRRARHFSRSGELLAQMSVQ